MSEDKKTCPVCNRELPDGKDKCEYMGCHKDIGKGTPYYKDEE